MRINIFADNSRVEPTIFLVEKLSFSLKLFSCHFYGQSFVKTVRGPLMSDVKDSRECASSTTHDTQLTQTTRYPECERRPPKHLDDYVTDLDRDQCMSNVDYFYRVSSFPQSYKEAISSTEYENWKKAMSEEMNSLRENETFTLTTLPEGRKSVGGRWVFTVK